jgi:hypothetical protein
VEEVVRAAAGAAEALAVAVAASVVVDSAAEVVLAAEVLAAVGSAPWRGVTSESLLLFVSKRKHG